MTIELHLEFDHPIRGDERVDLFVDTLKEKFPGILWNGGQEISVKEHNINHKPTFIVIRDFSEISTYSLLHSSNYVTPRDLKNLLGASGEEVPVTDGWKWVEDNTIDYDQTFGLFDQLNESVNADSILYEFSESISDDEWFQISLLLKNLYPGILWQSGSDLSEAKCKPFYGIAIHPPIGDSYFTKPRRVQCISIPNWYSDQYGKGRVLNGDKLLTDYDQTSGLFDQLNESKERYPRPLSLCFDPPITPETWLTVAEVLYNEGISWGAHESVLVYNPFDDEYAKQIMQLSYAQWYGESKLVLTYSEGDCNPLGTDSVKEVVANQDGWKWVEEHRVDYDQTSGLFDQLNESEEDGNLQLNFNPPIRRVNLERWKKVVEILNKKYPGIKWSSKQPLTVDSYPSRWPIYVLYCSDGYNWGTGESTLTYSNYIEDVNENGIDGHDWVEKNSTDYDKTSGLFDSLNESLLTEDRDVDMLYMQAVYFPPFSHLESDHGYRPQLSLDFNPRIKKEEFNRIAEILLSKYPSLLWWSGRPLTGDEIYKRGRLEGIGNLTIGYDESRPDRLTYSEELNPADMDSTIDGWRWVQESETDYDSTTSMFDQLNEAMEIPNKLSLNQIENYDNPKPNGLDILIYEFDKILTKEEWGKVASTLKTIFPKIRWASGTDITHNIHDIHGIKISNPNSSRPMLTCVDEPKWYTRNYPSVTPLDGNTLLNPDFNQTSDLFDQLNEAEHHYQPKLNLKFYEPIWDADELNKVLEVLNSVYPGLQWTSGFSVASRNPMEEDEIDFEYSPIWYLTIGYFEEKPNRLTYTNSEEEEYADDNQYGYNSIDGWKWVEDNAVNYDETSGLFDQLNESQESNEPKGGDLLICYNNINSGNKPVGWLTIGKNYEVVGTDNQSGGGIHIIGDKGGERHRFSILPDRYGFSWRNFFTLNTFIVDTDNLFNQLYEQEDDLEWAREVIDDSPIKVGDVFYVVDGNLGDGNEHPSDYRPKRVRYILTIVDIIPKKKRRATDKENFTIRYKSCDPEDVTYNPNDYQVDSPNCYEYEEDENNERDEEGYEFTDMNWFLSNLLPTRYWRKM